MAFRIEKDTMGEVQVPADKYWAATSKLVLQLLCRTKLLKRSVI